MLELQNVSKYYGDTAAVDGVSFSVRPGEVVGFLGPNGAGKSTTMKMIAGLLEPSSGQILYDGQLINQNPEIITAHLGFMPEDNPLYKEMLVHEYLDFVGSLNGIEAQKRKSLAIDAVQKTGLVDKFYQPISSLSKGYRQRVGLAAAILPQPKILILDEPTEGLDPNQRLEIQSLIREIGKSRTVILSTHILPEVKQTCDRVIIIHEGKIVADNPVGELGSQAKEDLQVTLLAKGKDIDKSLRSIQGMQINSESQRGELTEFICLISSDNHPGLALFDLAKKDGWQIAELSVSTPALEDLFRSLTDSR
ncbi:MAG: ATP-binding cassette domain-containing protein [Bacteroidota bacterium]